MFKYQATDSKDKKKAKYKYSRDLERSLIDAFVLVTFLNSKIDNEKSEERDSYHIQLKLLEGSILFLEIDYQFICTPEFC